MAPPIEAISTGPVFHDHDALGVAVSGGGDSMALLHAMAVACRAAGKRLEAATVDHGLRPEAADEARMVAGACADLGVAHQVLLWRDHPETGNVPALARDARYRLLAGWAQAQGLGAVAIGHTRDDQAETFLMRLARKPGVEGLSAMRGSFTRDGALFWRPFLDLDRAELREALTGAGIGWTEDPSNEDEAYDRARTRRILPLLGEIGIGRAELAATAENLRDAAQELRRQAAQAAWEGARVEAGDLVLEGAVWSRASDYLRRRLMTAALAWIAGPDYPPRRSAFDALFAALAAGKPHTLAGCLIRPKGQGVRIGRELQAVQGMRARPGAMWDGRWRLTGPDATCEIRALGEGIREVPDWRDTGVGRLTLMATPAVWQGETLVAAPLAGLENGWRAAFLPPSADFPSFTLSH